MRHGVHFVKKTLMRGKAWKFFFKFQGRLLDAFKVLAKTFYEKCMFFTENRRRVKISQNNQNQILFNNERKIGKRILNVPWGLIP